MSIRLRLTLWYVLVLTIGLAVFGSAVYLHVRQSDTSAFNQALHDRAIGVAQFVHVGKTISMDPNAPDEGAGQLGGASIWIRVVANGTVVASQGPPLAGVPDVFLDTVSPGFHNSGPLRLFVLPLGGSGGATGAVQAITTTTQLGSNSQQLLNSMLIAGLFIVALAGLGGLFLARMALRPVGRITQAAREIGAGDLSRRVSPTVGGRAGNSWRSGLDELEDLALTFDGMLDRLETADLRRRQLTADAAHELVTPVASIKSGAEVALRRERPAEEYREALWQVVSEAQHLEHIVDDLLLLAASDSGHLPMAREIVELDEVCRQTVQAMSALADSREITLELSGTAGAILVAGDETRLGQVIRNLLDNALTHTPRDGHVTMTIGRVEANARPAGVALSVSDTGPGIPPDERENVFERFHRLTTKRARADSDSRDGTGLGLAICKAIVEAHGGRIYVDGARGPGATFVVELPEVVAPSE